MESEVDYMIDYPLIETGCIFCVCGVWYKEYIDTEYELYYYVML